MAQEAGFVVDTEGFEAHMEQQRIQSGKKLVTAQTALDESLETTFTGYDEHRTATTIIGLVAQDKPCRKSQQALKSMSLLSSLPSLLNVAAK